jgi:hypothetical protein
VTSLLRRSAVLASIAASVLGLTACSGDVPGTATPSTTAPANPLASVQPCSLVTLDDQARLGLDPGKSNNTAKSRGCEWSKGTSYAVAIYLDGSQPIEAAGVNGVTVLPLQSHDAVQTPPDGLGCGIEIAISKTSSVAVNVSNVANACQLAQQYAGLIEPRLPAQEK